MPPEDPNIIINKRVENMREEWSNLLNELINLKKMTPEEKVAWMKMWDEKYLKYTDYLTRLLK